MLNKQIRFYVRQSSFEYCFRREEQLGLTAEIGHTADNLARTQIRTDGLPQEVKILGGILTIGQSLSTGSDAVPRWLA